MKKFLLYLTGIFIPVSMLVLLEGCSSEEDIPYKNSTERTIAEEYLEASEKAAVLKRMHLMRSVSLSQAVLLQKTIS